MCPIPSDGTIQDCASVFEERNINQTVQGITILNF